MPFDVDATSRTGLAETAFHRVQDVFASFRPTPHVPSQAQRHAIHDLLVALEAAADGRLSPLAHVSAIPPGTGKSVSVQTFAAVLCDAPDRDHVGMLILVNRINEARDMAEALARYRHRLCVMTSDFKVNLLGGHEAADKAQLLVTTQERLRRTLKSLEGLPFEAASTLAYRGSRRAVIAWDEQLAFNRPVVLDPNKATGLLPTLQEHNWRHAHECLNLWSWKCKDAEDGATIEVSDFSAEMPWEDLEEAVQEDDKLTALAHDLRVISGEQVRVKRSGQRSVVVSHYPELPISILPIVVTDASAQVNASYTKMRQKGLIKDLRSARKTYQNMHLRLVPMAASRSAFKENRGQQGKAVLDTVARYIKTVPAGEPILVIGYLGNFSIKGERTQTLDQALLGRLSPDDQKRVSWLHYGEHTATNAYRETKHVVLMGLHYTPHPLHVATTAAADDMDLLRHTPTPSDVADMRAAMLMDATLQAILRGHARMGSGGGCGECEVVVFQARQKGLTEDQWRKMFPEVDLIHDKVLAPKVPLKGRLLELATIVERRLSAGETEMSYPSLYEEMRMEKSNFARLIKADAWQNHMKNLGLTVGTLKGKVRGLRVG
jgi:hypothetical protein